MRTDINKINEHNPHTGLTEGMQVFAAGTSKYLKPVSGETIHQFI